MPHAAADAMLAALGGCERVLLTGPIEADGDSIGACLALRILLARRGVEAQVAGEPSYRYAWMPGAAVMLPDQAVGTGWDAVVVLDGDRLRLTPAVERAFEAAPVRGIIDHHASTSPEGYTVHWIEPGAPSTCEMLYEALVAWGEPIDAELASLLYTGAVFDTGGFRHTNTTPATHHMAARLLQTGIDHSAISARVLAERRPEAIRLAGRVFTEASFLLQGRLALGRVPLALAEELKLVPGDLEGLVDALVHTIGSEVGVLLVEREPGRVKASLRSRGRIDVARLARALAPTGGGHAKAAGVLLDGSVGEAELRVVEVLAAAFETA